jgi:hypothetical protein
MIVHLKPGVHQEILWAKDRIEALTAAYKAAYRADTLTASEQQSLARYALWANQRLQAIEGLCRIDDVLEHQPEDR